MRIVRKKFSTFAVGEALSPPTPSQDSASPNGLGPFSIKLGVVSRRRTVAGFAQFLRPRRLRPSPLALSPISTPRPRPHTPRGGQQNPHTKFTNTACPFRLMAVLRHGRHQSLGLAHHPTSIRRFFQSFSLTPEKRHPQIKTAYDLRQR